MQGKLSVSEPLTLQVLCGEILICISLLLEFFSSQCCQKVLSENTYTEKNICSKLKSNPLYLIFSPLTVERL